MLSNTDFCYKFTELKMASQIVSKFILSRMNKKEFQERFLSFELFQLPLQEQITKTVSPHKSHLPEHFNPC